MSDLSALRSEKVSAFNDASAQAEWAAQKWVYVKDEAEGFVAANIIEEHGETVKVKLPNGSIVDMNVNDTFKMNPPKFDKVEDMADLAYLNEPAVLDNLRKRYQSNLIYTYSGLFCVVVNPYKRLPIYTNEVIAAYKGKRRQEMPPHVYNVADSAYRDMLQDRENQSILITGESGAGKTENTKKVIQYLATVAGSGNSSNGTLEQQLLQCNPILEAFGNAKTIKNDNSSRFGKFIRIEFDKSGYISGGNIETYLLEKSRSVAQGPNERNFHIYYQLLKCASPAEKEECMLDDIAEIPYISDPGSAKVESINDQQDYADMLTALKVVGVSDDERRAIFRVLGGIMKSSQLKFVNDRSDQAQMTDDTKAAMMCKLYGIPLSNMLNAMLRPRMKVGRDLVTKAQRADQVAAAINAISKAVYERLFLYIVEKINKALDNRRTSSAFIGILDIAGFEIFKNNSFEQLCINYTNERLQQFFNNHMFIVEQEEYKKEGIEWTFIDFGLDLQPCIDLIEKPMGLLALLDEECMLLPRSSDSSYVEKLEKEHVGKTAKFSKAGGKIKRDQPAFLVEHYAGTVEYTCDNWLIKNTDPLNDNITELLSKSTDDLVKYLFRDFGDGERASGRRGGSLRTIAQLYRDQLNNLMTTLRNTSPHFVRCIIPNHEKKPGKLAHNLVLDQLRCNGVLEGIRICRKGFPNRVLFQDFRQRYEVLAPGAVPRGFMDGRKACENILKALQMDPNNYRIGSSKLFFRTGVLGMLEEMRDEKLSGIIRGLQAHCLGYLARKSYRRMTNHEVALTVIQRNCRKYLALRSWAWWKLFVRVQPLLKVTQEEAVKRDLEDTKKKLDESAKKNEDLLKDLDSMSAEKNQVKNELDKKISELITCNDTIDRLQTRQQQLIKDAQDLEDRLEEESQKADQLLSEKKKLALEREALEEELSTTKEKADKVSAEKNALEEKLKATELALDSEKDAHQKLQKEKANIESSLISTQESLAAAEDKLKMLQKSKGKVDSYMEDLENKLSQAEKDRNELTNAKRKTDSDLAQARETIEQLEKKVRELEAIIAQKQRDLDECQRTLSEEQEKLQRTEREKRELLAQVQELQEEVDSGQTAVEKLRKEKAELDAAMKALEASLEDNASAGAAQAELRAKRESELDNLNKKYQDLSQTSERDMAEAKRRFAQQLEEKETEIASLNKIKAESDKKLGSLQNQLGEANSKAEGEAKSRAELDKKRKAVEGQLAEAQARLQDAERKLAEAESQIAKLSSELESVSKKYDDRDREFSQLERDRKALQSKNEEIQALYEEETRQKLNFQAKLKSSEQELDDMREQIVERDSEKENLTRSISALNAQIADLKNKWAQERSATEESEASKKKLQAEIAELNNQLTDLQNQKTKLASTNSRIQGELEDLNNELSTARNEVANAVKKAKKAEASLAEHKSFVDKAEADRNAAQADASRLSAELYNAKNKVTELEELGAQLKKENGNLKAEINELKSGSDKDASYVANLEKMKRTLETMMEEQKTEIEELEDELQAAEDAKVRLEVSIQALKQQLDRDLQEKDERGEEARRGLIRQLKERDDQLEEERRLKAQLNSRVKALETELAQTRHVLDDADAQKEEANKQAKKAQQLAKDYQLEVEEIRAQLVEVQNQMRELEKKAARLASENAQSVAALDKSERARKSIESSRDEMQGEYDSLRSQVQALTDAKRRLDAEVASLKAEQDDLQAECDAAVDRERKASNEAEAARSAASAARDEASRLEQKSQALERQVNELRGQVEASGGEIEKKLKIRLIPLEQKIQSLTADLEAEQKKSIDAANKNKRLERKIREVQVQAEDAEKASAEHKANSDRATSKIRNLSTQIEEMEAELGTLRQKNRRLQSEVNEATEMAEQLRSQLSSTTARAGRTALRQRRSGTLEEVEQADAPPS